MGSNLSNFEHIQTVIYHMELQDGVTIPMIALYNCNKIPTGVVRKHIQNGTGDKYLLKLTMEQFNALFLDDFYESKDNLEVANETEENNN